MAVLRVSSSGKLMLHTEFKERDQAKTIPDFRWSFNEKCWVFALSREKINQIKQVFPDLIVDSSVDEWVKQEDDNNKFIKLLKMQKGVKLPSWFKPKIPLFAHQTIGVAFILKLKKACIFDEMGLGKSAQALISFVISTRDDNIKRCLVVAPKSLLYNWGEEIKKHTDFSFTILHGDKKKRDKIISSIKTPILITSYDTMRLHKDDKILLNFVKDNFMIIDEATYIKNPRALRTKAIVDLPAKYKVLLTGSPILTHAEDVYSLIQCVKKTWLNWWQFENDFIIRDLFGGIWKYKNLDVLKEKLDNVSLRRLKNDVLDLPAKVYEDRIVEMTPVQAERYKICLEELKLAFSGCDEKTFNLKKISFLTSFVRLNQISSGLLSDGKKQEFIHDSGKFSELDEIINDLPDKKIVVWSTFVPVILYLYNKYKDKSVKFHGDMSPEERNEAINRFKTDLTCQLFISQTNTGGMGVNLTEAQTEIFFDLPYSPGVKLQAEDRLHRIGQTGTVNIIHLLNDKSIDLKLKWSLHKKIKIITQVVSGYEVNSDYSEAKNLLEK